MLMLWRSIGPLKRRTGVSWGARGGCNKSEKRKRCACGRRASRRENRKRASTQSSVASYGTCHWIMAIWLFNLACVLSLEVAHSGLGSVFISCFCAMSRSFAAEAALHCCRCTRKRETASGQSTKCAGCSCNGVMEEPETDTKTKNNK